MTTKEKNFHTVVYILSALLVIVSFALSAIYEGGASLEACAGCLNMAAGLGG